MLGIFAIGIPVFSGFLVRSSASQSRLHALVTGALRDELGLRATIGRVRLQLVPLSIIATDITLDDPIYGRIAEADQLAIEPSFRTLLRGGLDIDAIRVRGATLRLVVRNGQVRNLPRAEGGGGGGITLPFDLLEVQRSTLIIDAEPHASGRLSNVDLRLYGIDQGIGVRARAQSGWVRHERAREVLTELSGHVEVTEDEVRVHALTVRTPDLSLSVEEGLAAMPFDDHGYRGHVQLRYDLAQLARLPLPEEVTLPPIVGVISLDVQLASAGEAQSARGTVDLTGGRIEQFGLGDSAHLVVDANRQRILILDGSFATNTDDGGRVGIEGGLQLDEARGFPLAVTASVSELSFARLMRGLDVTQNAIVEWMFDGTLRLEGTLLPLTLEGPIRLHTYDFRVAHDPYHAPRVRRVIGMESADFTGRWSIRDDAVRFTDLVGTLPHGRLRGDVHLGYDNRLGVHAIVEGLDLADVTPLDRWAIGGRGDATVDIVNTFQDPRVTGHVRMEDFFFDSFQLGTIESDAVLDPDGLGVRFTMVEAVRNESRYRAEDLYLDFRDNRFAMEGLLHLDGLLLADFYSVFGFEEDERFTSYQGLARGQATMRYTNGFAGDSPSGTLDVALDLALDWVELDGFRFEDARFGGHWRWLDWDRGARGAELAIAHLTMRKGRGTIAVEGNLSLGGGLALDVVADRITLAELEGIGDRLPGVDGIASVVGHVGGDVDVMRADFDLGITNVTYDNRPLGDGRFFVRLTDQTDPFVAEAASWNRAALPDAPCAHARDGLAHANWPADPPLRTRDGPEARLTRPMAYLICGRALDDRVAVDLAVGRTHDLPVRGMLRVDELALAALLPDSAEGMAGTLSGEVSFAHGALRNPETLIGDIVLDQLRVAIEDLELANEEPLAFSFEDGALTIDDARLVGPGSRLRVEGRASIDDGYGLAVSGDVDLALAAQLSDAVTESSGRLRAALRVSGPLDDPELYGEAWVHDGTLRLAALDTPIDGLEGHIRFSQRTILFENFTANVAGGQLEASGSAGLRDTGLERYAFALNARGLTYTLGDGVEASFGAETHLRWAEGERLPTLDGEVRVSRFEYGRPIELRSLGDVAGSAVRGLFRRARTEVRQYDPEQDSLAIDLRVVQQGPFLIENNLLQAEVEIDSGDRPFRVVGTDQRYGVDGAMRIPRGHISFQNSEFDIRRGVIQFADPTRINPHLDIEASTEIRRNSDLSSLNWRVLLRLTGSADNLRMTTESDPDLPQPDILMLLAFGMTRAELQQLQLGDVGSVAALEALSSATGLDRAIQRAIPLIDDVRLTTGYSTRTGRTEPRLSVGKRLAERVRLSATTGLGEGREFRGALEWQLDDNSRVGVSYDNYNIDPSSSFGNLGVDLGYRLEFE